MRRRKPRLRRSGRDPRRGTPAPAPRGSGAARRRLLGDRTDSRSGVRPGRRSRGLPRPGFLADARAASFEPGFGHVSTQAEWDDYEWSWTGSLVDWALHEAPTDDDRQQALSTAREHRRQWLGGYRGVLGFATVVLHDVATPQGSEP
ncbi:hypothetical protein [Pseudokineococcus sp. 1T1Z-3]|uniref:hypothetical protein n=1 Tax=Pseudokineococcus sp. 1T1Z-3 TaxID=3132745 RepID=UPI0030A0D666